MNNRYKVIGSLLFVGMLTVLAAWRFFSYAPQPNDSRLHVVAAETFWGDIVQQIGGSAVKVDTIMSDPTVDPHMYESSAHDALVVSRARLLVVNGLGYDTFMDKLAGASPNSQRVTLSVAASLNVSSQDANPHLWYDLNSIPAVATAFEEQLVRLDPVHSAGYRANLQTFIKSLRPLQAKQRDIVREYAGAPVAYTERVPQYMLEEVKLSVKTPAQFALAVEEGNDPSPASQNAMSSLIKNKQIRVLLYNDQATSPVTERVRSQAAQAGIPVVGVGEIMPADIHFQEWQLRQLTAIQNALK